MLGNALFIVSVREAAVWLLQDSHQFCIGEICTYTHALTYVVTPKTGWLWVRSALGDSFDAGTPSISLCPYLQSEIYI